MGSIRFNVAPFRPSEPAPPADYILGEAIADCFCCALGAGKEDVPGGIHPVGPFWTVNRDVKSPRPCIVLQTRRHVDRLEDLADGEAVHLGLLLSVIPGALKEICGLESYVYYLNELEPPHVHLHVIPKLPTEPSGPQLMDIPFPSGEPAWAEDVAEKVSEKARDSVPQRDRLVEAGSSLIGFVQDRISPHRPFRLLWKKGQTRWAWRSEEAAPAYVLLWLGTLCALLATARLWQGTSLVADAVMAIALIRYADLVSFHLRPLVDGRSVAFAAFRRSLLLLMINIAEMTLIVGVLLAASAPLSPIRAWLAAFFVITATSTTPGTVQAEIFQVLGVVANLLLLAIGLATWVSLIGGGFVERRHA